MKFEDKDNAVLVIDDEPFQAEWLKDYFVARGLEVVECPDLQSALDALERTRYRYVVIDLSIPFSPALAQPLASLGTEFFRYPGLMAARQARTTGHNTYQVIVYSVHDSDEVETYAERIRCRYILKGRPRELKTHIEATFDKRPHGWSPAAASGPPKKFVKASAPTPKRKPATKAPLKPAAGRGERNAGTRERTAGRAASKRAPPRKPGR